MDWNPEVMGTAVLPLQDWSASGLLARIDPYLVWLDVSGFRGVALPPDHRIPIVMERAGRYASAAMGPAELAALLREDPPPRFEVAPAFVSEYSRPLSSVLPVQAQDRRDVLDRHASPLRPVLGFIDYGCAFAHRQFRSHAHGADLLDTRVLAIWDQEGSGHEPRSEPKSLPRGLKPLQWRVPADYGYGRETHRDRYWLEDEKTALPLNEYIRQFAQNGSLDEENCYRYSGYAAIIGKRFSHGTHVMDVATGYPNPVLGAPRRPPVEKTLAHDWDIVFVQLTRQIRGQPIGGLLRANVYDGLCYIADCAPADQDVIINLSYGANAGPHDGSSVLEQAIDALIESERKKRKRFEVVIPSGNARERRMHVQATLKRREDTAFRWNTLPDDPSDSFVEVWLPRDTGFEIEIQAPDGSTSGPLVSGQARVLHGVGARPVALAVFPRQAHQSDKGTMLLLATAPTSVRGGDPRSPFGRWTLIVRNTGPDQATVNAWCERDEPIFGSEGLPRQSYFDDDGSLQTAGTLNSIAHGRYTTVVGGYVPGGTVAAYSGTGPGRDQQGRLRNAGGVRGPQLLAPSGENVGMPSLPGAAILGTDSVRLDGTSIAAALRTRAFAEGRSTPKGASNLLPSPTLSSHPDADLLVGALGLAPPPAAPPAADKATSA